MILYATFPLLCIQFSIPYIKYRNEKHIENSTNILFIIFLPNLSSHTESPDYSYPDTDRTSRRRTSTACQKHAV
nr:MAG TPA: hypothetical protein [Herelleviridae sp.]